ncbi:MAG: polysaccharide deacetylase family protein [Candidatus Omnitrophota bacterium]
MLRKRDFFAKILKYSGYNHVFLMAQKMMNNNTLRILSYHRVLDIQKDKFFLDERLIDADSYNFERQMNFIKDNFSVISFAGLRQMLNRDGEKIKNPLIITFDDGYKDIFEVIYPILRKLNLPATVFLTTGYIGKDELPWWDKISYIIKKTQKEQIKVKCLGDQIYNLKNLQAKKLLIQDFTKAAKGMSDVELKKAVKETEEELRVVIDKNLEKDLFVTWQEITEMLQNSRIEFGAHTVNHKILTKTADYSELHYEMSMSKDMIEEKINKKINVFSYPNGDERSFNKEIKNMLRDIGYDFAVTNMGDLNKISNLDIFALNRIHISMHDNLPSFKSRVIFPQFIGK